MRNQSQGGFKYKDVFYTENETSYWDTDGVLDKVSPSKACWARNECSDHNSYGNIHFKPYNDAQSDDEDKIVNYDDEYFEDPYVFHNGDEVITSIGGGIVVQIDFDNECIRVFLGETGLHCWFRYDEAEIVCDRK